MPDNGSVPAVLYAAKSTEDKHASIPDQLGRGHALAERESWTIEGEFSDEGFSAYSRNRGPGLERAKQLAIELAKRKGRCFLVALHSDRVARGAGDAPNAADHLVEVVAFLRRHGVNLRTVEDDFFADDRIGLLMAAVMGQRNTEDSRRKSESVASGVMRRVRDRGMHSGPAPYGYDYATDGSGLRPDSVEAAVVGRVFTEFVAGQSLSRIARKLHDDGISLWRVSTISGMLRNPIYIGKVRNNGETFDGIHEPIIDVELWERAARLVSATPTRRGRPTKEKRHIFTGGFLRCGACGEAMCPRTRHSDGYEFYECNGRKLHDCKTGAFRRVDIDEAVLLHFEQLVLDLDATREEVASAIERRAREVRALLRSAEQEAHRAKERLVKIKRDYTHGDLTAVQWHELREELEPEVEAANAEAQRLHDQLSISEDDLTLKNAEEEVAEQLARLRATVSGDLDAAESVEEIRAILAALFEKFIFHPELPSKAHVELIGGTYWIEPIVNERAARSLGGSIEPKLDPSHEQNNLLSSSAIRPDVEDLTVEDLDFYTSPQEDH